MMVGDGWWVMMGDGWWVVSDDALGGSGYRVGVGVRVIVRIVAHYP